MQTMSLAHRTELLSILDQHNVLKLNKRHDVKFAHILSLAYKIVSR